MKALLRKIRLALGKMLLDKNVQGQALPANPKIIVLQQDGKIGDYIVSSFIFRELKRHNPKMQVDVVCSPKNVNLFEQNPSIDHCFILNRKEHCAYSRMGKQLSHEHYDVLINLPVLLRNHDLWLTRLIHAKNNIGYKKQNYKLFNLNVTQDQLHFSKVYAEAIKLCGVKDINLEYDIPNHSDKKEDIANFIQKNHLVDCIAINFFGAAGTRKFTEQNIYRFMEKFKAENKKALLLTYPEVTPLLKTIAEKYTNAFIYENTENIFDTITLLHYTSLVISPDTSIIHIAAGLNKKIIGFYKLADKENFTHWNPNCKNKTYILNFIENVNEISPDEIKSEWLK
ncbi:glycosyltransferase family 9 protein [Aggregatibacter actinomycetemcomitans]|uniref:glycosyltransferase family 9 protein n=1 Tax=Aggregatibacter actinomycetemcomitans TaxID=714 RepID=UPI00215AF5A2|nr:glycosyltransferase family 9 protein [Aggregatibacter actinomycetemcomitans]